MPVIGQHLDDRAGLQPGDVAAAVNGQPLTDSAQLRNVLARARVGSVLRLTVDRRGRRLDVEIEVEEGRTGV